MWACQSLYLAAAQHVGLSNSLNFCCTTSGLVKVSTWLLHNMWACQSLYIWLLYNMFACQSDDVQHVGMSKCLLGCYTTCGHVKVSTWLLYNMGMSKCLLGCYTTCGHVKVSTWLLYNMWACQSLYLAVI